MPRQPGFSEDTPSRLQWLPQCFRSSSISSLRSPSSPCFRLWSFSSRSKGRLSSPSRSLSSGLHPALYSDHTHLNHRVRSCEEDSPSLRRRRTLGDDRGLEPFRGCYRHGNNSFRACMRGCACNGRRGVDRSANHAPAGEDLFENKGMVRMILPGNWIPSGTHVGIMSG